MPDALTNAHRVLCQAFSYDHMHIPSRGGWSWTSSYQTTLAKSGSFLSGGSDKTYISGGAGERLAFYLAIRFGFGWNNTFMPLIREYSAIHDGGGTVPSKDADKANDFAERMSRLTNHNMVPYMQRWGVPVDSAVESSIAASYPAVWFPVAATCHDAVVVAPGAVAELQLLQDVHNVTAVRVEVVEAPAHGALRAVSGAGDGRFEFHAPAGFVAAQQLKYRLVPQGSDVGQECVTPILVTGQVDVVGPGVAVVANRSGTATFSAATATAVRVRSAVPLGDSVMRVTARLEAFNGVLGGGLVLPGGPSGGSSSTAPNASVTVHGTVVRASLPLPPPPCAMQMQMQAALSAVCRWGP